MNASVFPTFIDIIRFKGQPSALPHSSTLWLITAVLSTLTAAALIVGTKLINNPVSYSALQLIAFSAFYFLILQAHNVGSRFIQSSTALFGVNTLFQCLAFVLAIKLGVVILSFIFTLWNFATQVYIVKETLESSPGKAVMVCLALQVVSSVALIFIFPESVEAMRSALQQSTTTP